MLQIQHFKDINVARYDGDEDVVLFVPATSDVLRCSASTWEALRDLPHGEPVLTAFEPSIESDPPSPIEVLRSTLIKLGAKFH